MSGALRLSARAAVATLLGFAAGTLLLLGGAHATGHEALSVLSGSMAPALHTGDVLVTDPMPAAQARVGDVITFADPASPGRLLTHRVRSIRPSGDMLQVVTKGDANTGVERWAIARDGKVALTERRLPLLGFALVPARSPAGRIVLLTIPCLLLMLLELRRLWRRPAALAVAPEAT